MKAQPEFTFSLASFLSLIAQLFSPDWCRLIQRCKLPAAWAAFCWDKVFLDSFHREWLSYEQHLKLEFSVVLRIKVFCKSFFKSIYLNFSEIVKNYFFFFGNINFLFFKSSSSSLFRHHSPISWASTHNTKLSDYRSKQVFHFSHLFFKCSYLRLKYVLRKKL